MRIKHGCLAALAILLVGIGCGCDSGPQQLDQDYMAKSEAEGKQKREIFERAEGEFEKMSAEDRQKYLSFFKSEQEAKDFWELMKNPPRAVGAPDQAFPQGS